jgi:hypothetical protein
LLIRNGTLIVKLVSEHIPTGRRNISRARKNGNNEAHEDEQAWDAFYILSNKINDKYLVVTLSVSALRNT